MQAFCNDTFFMRIIDKEQLLVLLEKQRLGTCTEAEEALLNQWFDEPPVIEALTFVSDEEKERIKSDIHTAIRARIATAPQKSRRLTFRIKAIAAAAALLVCLSLLGVYFFSGNGTEQMIEVTAPQGIAQLPVTLPDSSLVWLSGGSSIRYPEHFASHERHVTLDGIAHFSVQPNKQAPFTVYTPEHVSVKVLGTSFVVDVRRGTKRVEISVITGLVQVDEDKDKLDVLKPGEKLSYSCNDKSFRKKKYAPEEVKAWNNNGIIYLNAVSLSEISVLLQTMYHVNLKYDPKQTAPYRFNMSFSRDLTVDAVLDMLHSVSGLSFEHDGKNIKITQ
ncbi:FecR family protein [Taibaiella chishuiensis]|uniref:FecR family protein n=2 Tax=Taibaiella chishuiensis TaxID=1434707 RepID=A0A2P8D7Q7_9BACT|nr:FecR family protein [Taibaiella chishuiensis]